MSRERDTPVRRKETDLYPQLPCSPRGHYLVVKGLAVFYPEESSYHSTQGHANDSTIEHYELTQYGGEDVKGNDPQNQNHCETDPYRHVVVTQGDKHGSVDVRDQTSSCPKRDSADDHRPSSGLYPALQSPQTVRAVERLYQVPLHTGITKAASSTPAILFSVLLFILDIITDFILAITLHNLAVAEADTPAGSDTHWWFVTTVLIIIVPMIVINCFSLWWYWQNKLCLGDYCVLHRMTICKKLFTVTMHLLLLGPMVRYLDLLYYKRQMKGQMRTVRVEENGQSISRLSPQGEVFAVLQMVIARDTAMLDMLHSFLQDAPQLVFQVFLLYRRPSIIASDTADTATVTVQVVKISLALFSLALSLIVYQDELRRGQMARPRHGLAATVVCLVWRIGMVAARVISIASFAALVKNGSPRVTGIGYFGFERRDDPGDPFTYPVITCFIFAAHWLLMTVWIHMQKSNFCASPENEEPRPWLELLYSTVMGWVHIFCFINHKQTPSRKRMFFFYLLTFIENSVLIGIWYVQITVATELWFRVSIVCSVQVLYLMGLCSIFLYYSFCHPQTALDASIRHYCT